MNRILNHEQIGRLSVAESSSFQSDVAHRDINATHLPMLARYLYQRTESKRLIELTWGSPRVGCPNDNTVRLDLKKFCLGDDVTINTRFCPEKLSLLLRDDLLSEAVVVFNGVFDACPGRHELLAFVGQMAKICPFVVFNAGNQTSLVEFSAAARRYGLGAQTMGYLPQSQAHTMQDVVAIWGTHVQREPVPLKRILAVVSCYNDEDIIESTLRHLLSQDVDIWLIDNWSQDKTWPTICSMQKQAPHKIIGIERFPDHGADREYDWNSILLRKEEIGQTSGYDWIIHYDSDEIRTAPWHNVTLGEAVSWIDSLGYTAIDHTLIDFRPTKEGFTACHRPQEFFNHFEFCSRPGAFEQVKGWAAQPKPVGLNKTGGHNIQFDGCKVYPLKFLLSHYSLRSTQQAQKKIFVDRLPRFGKEQKNKGWHYQYDHLKNNPKVEYIKDEKDLIEFNPATFHSAFFVERLSGINIARVI